MICMGFLYERGSNGLHALPTGAAPGGLGCFARHAGCGGAEECSAREGTERPESKVLMGSEGTCTDGWLCVL